MHIKRSFAAVSTVALLAVLCLTSPAQAGPPEQAWVPTPKRVQELKLALGLYKRDLERLKTPLTELTAWRKMVLELSLTEEEKIVLGDISTLDRLKRAVGRMISRTQEIEILAELRQINKEVDEIHGQLNIYRSLERAKIGEATIKQAEQISKNALAVEAVVQKGAKAIAEAEKAAVRFQPSLLRRVADRFLKSRWGGSRGGRLFVGIGVGVGIATLASSSEARAFVADEARRQEREFEEGVGRAASVSGSGAGSRVVVAKGVRAGDLFAPLPVGWLGDALDPAVSTEDTLKNFIFEDTGFLGTVADWVVNGVGGDVSISRTGVDRRKGQSSVVGDVAGVAGFGQRDIGFDRDLSNVSNGDAPGKDLSDIEGFVGENGGLGRGGGLGLGGGLVGTEGFDGAGKIGDAGGVGTTGQQRDNSEAASGQKSASSKEAAEVVNGASGAGNSESAIEQRQDTTQESGVRSGGNSSSGGGLRAFEGVVGGGSGGLGGVVGSVGSGSDRDSRSLGDLKSPSSEGKQGDRSDVVSFEADQQEDVATGDSDAESNDVKDVGDDNGGCGRSSCPDPGAGVIGGQPNPEDGSCGGGPRCAGLRNRQNEVVNIQSGGFIATVEGLVTFTTQVAGGTSRLLADWNSTITDRASMGKGLLGELTSLLSGDRIKIAAGITAQDSVGGLLGLVDLVADWGDGGGDVDQGGGGPPSGRGDLASNETDEGGNGGAIEPKGPSIPNGKQAAAVSLTGKQLAKDRTTTSTTTVQTDRNTVSRQRVAPQSPSTTTLAPRTEKLAAPQPITSAPQNRSSQNPVTKLTTTQQQTQIQNPVQQTQNGQ